MVRKNNKLTDQIFCKIDISKFQKSIKSQQLKVLKEYGKVSSVETGGLIYDIGITKKKIVLSIQDLLLPQALSFGNLKKLNSDYFLTANMNITLWIKV